MSRILAVDDEVSIRNLLARVLGREGFDVLLAKDGREGFQLAADQNPDLVILDLNLPDTPGEEICQRIRQTPSLQSVPVLILTGRGTEGLLPRCLNGGADDYVAKPFDIKELVARVRALLRRPRVYCAKDSVIENGRLSIRVAERQVLWKGTPIEALAPREFEMLRFLVLQAPGVIDKTVLALNVWGSALEGSSQRTLDVHIRRIRKKLGPQAASCLKTIPSVGFQWLDPAAAQTPQKPRRLAA
jgi:DNA-binding response OmpR family regulator